MCSIGYHLFCSVRLSLPGTLAAYSLATAGHHRYADCGPVRGRT